MIFDVSKILDLLDQVIRLDEDEAWFFVIDKETKDQIIQMNTEDQLEEDGVFSTGERTGDYADSTKMYKRSKGQRLDHITFKDSGAFYNSWVVEVDSKGFTIDADGQVSADTNLFKFYGEDILGLTDENRKHIIDIITGKYIEFIYQKLGL